MVSAQSGQARLRQARQSVVGAGIGEHVVAVGIDQREVDMNAVALELLVALAQERESATPIHGAFTGQHSEEKGVIGSAQRIGIAKRQLELSRVELGIDRFERDVAAGCEIDDVVDQADGVHQAAGSIDVGLRRIPSLPAVLFGELKHVGLELDAHHGAVAQRFPIGDRLAQGIPSGVAEWLTALRQVADGHLGPVIVPARPKVGGVEGGMHVGKAVEYARPGCGDE